jgi:hypothetical protein
MTPDGLKERLSEIPTPPAPQAREQAVAEARAEIAARACGPEPASSRRSRALSLAAVALLAIVVLLTPPGRAASAWVGELVGIGDVGGPPTREEHGGFVKPSTAVVIDNGTAPDGTRYEWLAYQCKLPLSAEGSGPDSDGIGISLDWPGVKGHERGGFCEELEGRPRPPVFGSHGVHVLPSQMKGVAEPDVVIEGTTGPDVHDVRVFYRDGEGRRQELPVDFARVEGKLREIASRPEPLGTFIAFLPGDVAARDEVVSRLDLRAQFGTGDLKLGPIGRRERDRAREAFERCGPIEADPDNARPCYERLMPRGPFEYVAYDENGRVLDRRNEPLVPAMVRPPTLIEAEGHEEPGDKRARRLAQSEDSITVPVMSGRSPDGALYELFIDRSSYGDCISISWPYANGEGWGFCGGDKLPPSTAFGRRNPEAVFAKPYGFLNDAAAATTHRVISGFARPNVDTVRVVYLDRDGSRHEAPVQLTQVGAEKLERVPGSSPFGFWVAFVPRSAGHRPLEVTAFADNGERLGEPFTLARP